MVTIFSLADLGGQTTAQSGVLKKCEAETITSAQRIIAEAQAQAEKILSDAYDHFEQEKARGFALGQAEAKQQAMKRLLSENEKLDKHLVAMQAALGKVVNTSVKKLVASFDDQQKAQAVAQSALNEMRQENKVQLRVPAGLVDRFQSYTDDLIAMFPEVELIDLVEDADLEGSQVILESQIGTVFCDVDDRMSIFEGLIEHLRAETKPETADEVSGGGAGTS